MILDIEVPENLSSAMTLVENGFTVLAGGTSLMPGLNERASPPTRLVSLRKVGLSGLEVDGARITIGATTTLARLQRHDRLAFLSPVVRSVASPPVRSLATVGGNLFVSQPYGDLSVALVALGATASLTTRLGSHDTSVEDLVSTSGVGDGLVTSIQMQIPRPGTFRFAKAMRRRFNSASIVTVAAVVDQADGVMTAARVALGGIAPKVLRARAVEASLVGRALNEATVGEAADAGLAEIAPSDDSYASAWYRTRVFPVHLRRALLGH